VPAHWQYAFSPFLLSSLPSLPPSLSYLESCFTSANARRNRPLEKKEDTTVNFCSPADMNELKNAATTLGVALGPGGMEGGAILEEGRAGEGGRERGGIEKGGSRGSVAARLYGR